MSKVGTTGAIEVAPIQDSSLLAFYRDMNLPERRIFWACAAGWALDGMDFMIYPLVIGTIIVLWKVDPGTAGLAGTVTLLASAIGGWLGGYLADRIGRVKTLQLTILWFSAFSLLCAVVRNFGRGIGALFPYLVGALGQDIARQCHRGLCSAGLWIILRRGLRATGNARQDSACGCLNPALFSIVPPYTAHRARARAHRPGGRECDRETPSPWGGPARARRAPRLLRAESSSGYRRR
jgi:MFS family permease